jgi:Bifunctional DNA primase/polymerase, N-terminal
MSNRGKRARSASAEIALSYIARNWNPIPVPYRAKNPVLVEWQKLTITAESVTEYFNGRTQNIGVQFGKKSGGLTDVDLDCAEAVRIVEASPPPPEDREILPPWAAMVLFVLAAVLLIALVLSWLGI